MNGKPWTPADLAQLRILYPSLPTKQVAELMGRSMSSIYNAADIYGVTKTAEYLASPDACRLRRGDEVGKSFRYPKGNVPANKGLRRPGWAPGRMASTQFKAGEMSGAAQRNWMPIGTIRTDAEGFLRIKIREGVGKEARGFGNVRIWPLLNRHVWEQHHGPIPPGHAVVFRDKDRSNCDIANLELITRRELMLRNSSQRWGPEVFQLIQLRGAINRKLRGHDEKQNDESAQPLVRDTRGAKGHGEADGY